MSRTAAGLMVVSFMALASCTLEEQQPPALMGPSEFAVSLTVAAMPDVLPTDGRSQSLIAVTVRDAYGLPVRNLSIRTETLLNKVVVDLGTLSARNVITDASGRATLTYTAPSIDGEMDTGTVVEIGMTPIGSNFATAVMRTTAIRLVPVIPLR